MTTFNENIIVIAANDTTMEGILHQMLLNIKKGLKGDTSIFQTIDTEPKPGSDPVDSLYELLNEYGYFYFPKALNPKTSKCITSEDARIKLDRMNGFDALSVYTATGAEGFMDEDLQEFMQNSPITGNVAIASMYQLEGVEEYLYGTLGNNTEDGLFVIANKKDGNVTQDALYYADDTEDVIDEWAGYLDIKSKNFVTRPTDEQDLPGWANKIAAELARYAGLPL